MNKAKRATSLLVIFSMTLSFCPNSEAQSGLEFVTQSIVNSMIMNPATDSGDGSAKVHLKRVLKVQNDGGQFTLSKCSVKESIQAEEPFDCHLIRTVVTKELEDVKTKVANEGKECATVLSERVEDAITVATIAAVPGAVAAVIAAGTKWDGYAGRIGVAVGVFSTIVLALKVRQSNHQTCAENAEQILKALTAKATERVPDGYERIQVVPEIMWMILEGRPVQNFN